MVMNLFECLLIADTIIAKFLANDFAAFRCYLTSKPRAVYTIFLLSSPAIDMPVHYREVCGQRQ